MPQASTAPFSLLLKRGVRRGFLTAMREEGFSSAVGSLFGVLLLAQVLMLLTVGAQSGLILLREQTDIRIEILEGARQEQIQDLYQGLRSQPYVEEVMYISKEQALERAKLKDPQLIAFLSKFGIDNPFPETMGIRLKNLEQYQQLSTFLAEERFATTINPSFLNQATDQESQVYRLLDIVNSARAILLVVEFLLVVVLLFIVVELVRRRAVLRRDELLVEQLVGATPLAILLPFCTEVLTLLSLALVLSLIASGILTALLPWLVPALSSTGLFANWAMTTLSTLLRALPWLILLQIVLLPAAAAAGTAIAIWPKLKRFTLPIQG